MFHLATQIRQEPSPGWSRLIDRLIYLPGAVIILYGVWLLVSGNCLIQGIPYDKDTTCSANRTFNPLMVEGSNFKLML
jgi:hypothetical protein